MSENILSAIISTNEVDRDGTIITEGAFGCTNFRASGAVTKDSPKEEIEALPAYQQRQLKDGSVRCVFTRIEPCDELATEEWKRKSDELRQDWKENFTGDPVVLPIGEEAKKIEADFIASKAHIQQYLRNPVFSYGFQYD